MSIDSWLTTIGLLIAILAFFPREELKLLGLKLTRFELVGGTIMLLFVLPCLIYFDDITSKIDLLKCLYTKRGIEAKTVAFLVLYALLLWLFVRVFWIFPSRKNSTEIVAYYKELLKEISFDKFFNIFRKYENMKLIGINWQEYRELILQPQFLSGVIAYQPDFIYQHWRHFDYREDFDVLLNLYINDPDSAYYKEIKSHWNSGSVMFYSSPLLNDLICLHLRISLKHGILNFISLKGREMLHRESNNPSSIYLQRPIFLDAQSEGTALPMFYHIQFISLLYYTSIEKGIDIEAYPLNGKHMLTIYSEWIIAIFDNLKQVDIAYSEKEDTNYHWLIDKMIDNIGRWLEVFNETAFDGDFCSYTDYLPHCLGLCFDQLYKAINKGLVPVSFTTKNLHYNVLKLYYRDIKPELRKAIEKWIIAKIPQTLCIVVFNYSLDEEYAMNFDDFYAGVFPCLQDTREKEVVTRLRKLLADNNQLGN